MSEGYNFFPRQRLIKIVYTLLPVNSQSVSGQNASMPRTTVIEKTFVIPKMTEAPCDLISIRLFACKTFQNLPAVNHALPSNLTQKKLVVTP